MHVYIYEEESLHNMLINSDGESSTSKVYGCWAIPNFYQKHSL